MHIAASLGHVVVEADFTRSDLGRSPTKPSHRHGRRDRADPRDRRPPIGEPGPLTQEIQRTFHEITSGRSASFAQYLEYVDEAVKA